jgi:hypothetical protein
MGDPIILNDVEIWEVINGEVTAIRYGGSIYRLEKSVSLIGRKSILEKWIKDNKKVEFDLKDFYKIHPEYESRYKERLEKVISHMIECRKLIQLSNTRFKVVKRRKGR